MAVQHLRTLFVLPGAHRVARGAEVAFEAVAEELAAAGHQVTLMGGGAPRTDRTYDYVHVPHRPREHFERHPTFPPLRTEIHWEQLSFARGLWRRYAPEDFDVTVSCDYPFVQWLLRWGGRKGVGLRHVYVTQNGDWPAQSSRSEFRFFRCDGLVCTNPAYFARNRDHHRCSLIPNGVDPDRFSAGSGERERLGLPLDRPVVLMVSALMPYKRVLEGIDVVGRLPDAELVVVGDGPQRDEVDEHGARRLPNRFRRITVTPAEMPAIYRSADVFLHMAADEPFGNVYIEALACGLPVVAPESETTRWIVGDDGFLVEHDDPAAYAESIRLALAAPGEHAAGRSDRCRTRFAWPVVAASYGSFLREVAESAPST